MYGRDDTDHQSRATFPRISSGARSCPSVRGRQKLKGLRQRRASDPSEGASDFVGIGIGASDMPITMQCFGVPGHTRHRFISPRNRTGTSAARPRRRLPTESPCCSALPWPISRCNQSRSPTAVVDLRERAAASSRGALPSHIVDGSEPLRVFRVPSLKCGQAIDGTCAFHRPCRTCGQRRLRK